MTAAPRADPANAPTESLGERWLECARRGDFAAAWDVSDAVLRERAGKPSWHLPRHEQWIWNGEPLHDKRVLIRCYHGLGDTLQFIRYAPMVKAIAREVVVWAQPSLLSLLATVDGVDRLLPLHDGDVGIDYDIDVELMELPHVFRTTLDTIPSRIPYVHVDPLPRERDGTFAVGIAWGSGDWEPRRSIPFAALAPLAQVDGVSLRVLQRGAHRDEWRPGFGTLTHLRDSFEEARFMRSLDLVISADSMPAHLAGALGVPVWTLLHDDPDWRWMAEGDRTPWYPTMRLFRQRRAGDWADVIERVAQTLSSRGLQ